MKKLRCSYGKVPDALTFIVLPVCRRANSGQVWQVMKVRGGTLHCMVMPPDHDYGNEPADSVYVWWEWDTRKRSR
jgi:hypothetical protein